MCGVEALKIINVGKSNEILQPKCTLQEAGITGDCLVIVEAVESEDAPAPFNALEYDNQEASSFVSGFTAISMV